MRIRSTVILCIIAVLGVAAAIFAERFGSQRVGGGALAPLLEADTLPVDEVSRIRLDRGDDAMEFVRDANGWMQSKPFTHPMEDFSLRQLAALANAVNVVDIIEPQALGAARSRAALGLDPPRAHVQFIWPGGELTLALGRRGIGGMAYAQIAGDERVYVVTQDLHTRASDMDVREWRDRAIFRGVGVDSDGIVIASGDTIIDLVQEKNHWRMERPVRTRLNDAARDALMQALGRTQVSGYVLDQPADLSQFGLDTPPGSVTVTTTRLSDRSGEVARTVETQRLSIGARVGVGAQDRFGIVDGRDTVVRVSEPVLRAFFLPAAQLVAQTASGAVPADVKSVRIEGRDGAVGFSRDLERSVAPDHDNRDVAPKLVAELLTVLTQVPAAEVELGEYPRELEVARITMFGYDGRPIDTVRVARETQAPGRWILENGDNVLRFHPVGTALRLTPREYGL